MELKSFVSRLESWASPKLGEKWDNVGLLLEPRSTLNINKVILTNDLTEDVLEEAIATKSDLILSYHPPIFAPLKRITSKNWKVMKCNIYLLIFGVFMYLLIHNFI